MAALKTFARFLWEKQAGLCYLGITEACLADGRRLHEFQLHKGSDHRGWTWEHVIPVAMCRQLLPNGSDKLKLLACRFCNGAKAASMPSDEHIELALALGREYFLIPGTSAKRGAIGAEIIASIDLLVAEYRRRGPEIAQRMALSSGVKPKPLPRVRPCADADVPNSIEEALAQGGIHVGAPKLRPESERQRKNAHSQASALRAIADRAERQGDKQLAGSMRARAWALIDKVA